jgi:hypothetical protein
MIKSILESYNQIDGRIQAQLVSSISNNPGNIFPKKCEGIVITDTFNNPIFPIEYPEIDISKESLAIVLKQYKMEYAKDMPTPMLPWHYVIEFSSIGNYVCYNTRPINMMYPLSSKDCNQIIKDNNVKLFDKETEDFFKNKEIQDYIHITIIGSSQLDVYTKFLYELIGRYCILPLSKIYRFPPMYNNGVYGLNMGDKFKSRLLEFYAK